MNTAKTYEIQYRSSIDNKWRFGFRLTRTLRVAEKVIARLEARGRARFGAACDYRIVEHDGKLGVIDIIEMENADANLAF